MHCRMICTIVICALFFIGKNKSHAGLQPAKAPIKLSFLAKKLALVIGIEHSTKSTEWPKLRYARSDAQRVAKVLREKARFDRITLLSSERRTTKQAILQSLKRLQQRVKSPEDMVFVYISAHGVVSRGRKRYIVTSNTSANVSKTGLSVEDLRKILKKLPSRKICLILATCYTGSTKSKAVRLQGHKGSLKPALPFKRSRAIQILSAASFAQAAFESSQLKSDVYTHFFLDCLSTLKKKTIIKVHVCASSKTTAFVQKWNGEVQVPKAYSELGANRDFLLIEKAKKQQQLGYFGALFKSQKKRQIRISKLGSKASSRKTIQATNSEYTALPPGRYLISIQDDKGTLLRKEEIQIEAGKVSYLLSNWSFEFQGGLRLSNGALQKGGDWLVGGLTGFRHKYFALLSGVWGTSLQFAGLQSSTSQILWELRTEGGYRWDIHRLTLFLGAFTSLGILVQDINQEAHLSYWFQGGACLVSGWQLGNRWTVRLIADIGVIPSVTLFTSRLFWSYSFRLGLGYRFG